MRLLSTTDATSDGELDLVTGNVRGSRLGRRNAMKARAKRFLSTADAARRVGIDNVARVVAYRVTRRAGLYERLLPVARPVEGPFFTTSLPETSPPARSTRLFGYRELAIGATPDWLGNPFAPRPSPNARVSDGAPTHWSRVDDFDPSVGDIKRVWELSRFDWAPRLAFAGATGDDEAVVLLEARTRDWCLRNPPNAGTNWKCGQESGLRSMNLLLANVLLNGLDGDPTHALVRLIEVHARRILPTTAYAVGQQNNHGTSEAAALFCAGVFLRRHGGESRALASRCLEVGRALVEDRVKALVMSDGSFSQNSVTYHRLMLETLCVAELFRRWGGERPFSERCTERLSAAGRWLDTLHDERSGDAPNLGSNDGADFANIEETSYRDFRPTVARAIALFAGRRTPTFGTDALLDAFGVVADELPVERRRGEAYFPDGGYARIAFADGRGSAMLRLPRYRFRPGHSDANHLDVWFDGVNVTRDDGSYSYNPDDPGMSGIFSRTAGHCTVEFDERDQMPRVSRFLRARWLRPSSVDVDIASGTMHAAYVDYRGARHDRRVARSPNAELSVIDDVSGFSFRAILRWRLPRADWVLDARGVSTRGVRLSVDCDEPFDMALGEAYESRRYLELDTVCELSVTVRTACRLRTVFRFDSSEAFGDTGEGGPAPSDVSGSRPEPREAKRQEGHDRSPS